MRVFLYSLSTAVKNLWREKWINTLTAMTISVGLLILGTFALVIVNLDSVMKLWTKGFGMIVYLDERIDRDQEEILTAYFKKDTDISDITYISKDDALTELRKALGESSTILEGFQDNPLPASFELKLKREALNPENIEKKAGQIMRLSGVNDVQYGEKWLYSLNTMTKGLKLIVIIVGSVILIAIAFSTYSTIKILFYRRLEEINTLKLLGATRMFIRLPFLLEGLFIGIAGGITGLFGLMAIYYFTSTKFTDFMPSLKGIVTFFPPELYSLALLAGILMSLVGSLFAIGKIRY